MPADNYIITEKTIKEPPTSFWRRLQFLGPGFILSASIVGSGELIATTTLGAKAGFIAFWIIIASCLVKVAVQLEFGKHAILHSGFSCTAVCSSLKNSCPVVRYDCMNSTISCLRDSLDID